MNIDFEVLEQIPQMMELIINMKKVLEEGQLEKRWLTTKEAADYLRYTHETMKKKVKEGEFIVGVEYYKQGRMNLFDKIQLDNRVMGIKPANNSEHGNDGSTNIVNDILDSIA